jgi:hypothetical protein
MDQLGKCVPSIKAIYQAYEDMGYDKDKILEKFKDHNWLKSLQTESADITYKSVGQELADQDSRRSSWTNEDPDWHSIANDLDSAIPAIHAVPDDDGTTGAITRAVPADTAVS